MDANDRKITSIKDDGISFNLPDDLAVIKFKQEDIKVGRVGVVISLTSV